jgi:hypothetical protein
MVEGRDDWLWASPRFGSTVSQHHCRVARSVNDNDARTSVPPTPPVVHLSRPVSEDHAISIDLAGPCDAILSTCDAEDRLRRRYFFFRRFAGFFAALAFAFLFFAIAALLA